MLTLHGNEVEKNKDTIDILNSASGNNSSELSESYCLERFPGARFIRG